MRNIYLIYIHSQYIMQKFRGKLLQIETTTSYLRRCSRPCCCGCDTSQAVKSKRNIDYIFRAAAAVAFVLIRQGSFGTALTLNACVCVHHLFVRADVIYTYNNNESV